MSKVPFFVDLIYLEGKLTLFLPLLTPAVRKLAMRTVTNGKTALSFETMRIRNKWKSVSNPTSFFTCRHRRRCENKFCRCCRSASPGPSVAPQRAGVSAWWARKKAFQQRLQESSLHVSLSGEIIERDRPLIHCQPFFPPPFVGRSEQTDWATVGSHQVWLNCAVLPPVEQHSSFHNLSRSEKFGPCRTSDFICQCPLTHPWLNSRSVWESLADGWVSATSPVSLSDPEPLQLLLLLGMTHHVRKIMAEVYECSTQRCWIGQHGGNLFSALTFGSKLGRLKGFATGGGSSMLGGVEGREFSAALVISADAITGSRSERLVRVDCNRHNPFLLQDSRNARLLL